MTAYINKSTEASREAARRPDGKFGTQEHAEANGGINALGANGEATVDLEDAGGDWVEVTPGVIDENAQDVYLHGQCLALAAAASKRTGWPVAAHTFTDYDDEWDEETDERVTFDNLKHAYVLRPDGALLDITGVSWGDAEALRAGFSDHEPGETLRIVPAEKVQMLLFEFDGYLVPQDVETADSFVEPMIELARQQDEPDDETGEEGDVSSDDVSGYGAGHRPAGPDYGVSADDVENFMPDYYDHPEWYRSGYPEADRESHQAIMAARGNPDAPIRIFRAVPSSVKTDAINSGDWMTTSRTYAHQHGVSNCDDDYKIIETTVRARDLWTSGDSINEWGFWSSD